MDELLLLEALNEALAQAENEAGGYVQLFPAQRRRVAQLLVAKGVTLVQRAEWIEGDY